MSGKNPGVIAPKNCDASVRQAIMQLATKVVGLESTPTFLGLTLTDLTASRIIASDSAKILESVSDLTSWVSGTANQVISTSDGDGTLTLSTPQDIHTGASPTFADLTLSNFSGGNETIDEILDDTLNALVLDTITVTDQGGLNITWSAGEIWDYANSAVVDTDAEGSNQACTDHAINYLKWVSGTTLTLSTTAPTDLEVSVATVNCSGGDIQEINHVPIYSKNISTLIAAFQDMFPSIVTSGLVVSEHAGDNAFDVDMTAGVYYSAAYAKETVASKDSTTDNLVRWYQSGASAWTAVIGQTQIDTTQWNNGTSLAAVNNAKYYRSLFFVTNNGINWVYPTEEFNTVAQAIAGEDPELPAGLTDHPKSTVVILRGDDAAFPTASGSQWIDRRPILGSDISGTVSDHGNLAGLSDDDHTQYILHSLADAENDFLVASGADTFVKKTLAEVGAILEGDIDHGNLQGLDTGADHSYIDQDVTIGSAPAFTADNFSDGGSNAIITTTQETNFGTAYTHSQLTSGNPHSVTPTELSLVIGTNTQAWDAGLDSLAALSYVSDSFIKVTTEDTYTIRTIAETKSDLSLNNVSNVATDDTAYNATSWDANTDAATKNAIRDKVETMDTAIGLNTTHRGSNGSDHSYINQDVTSGSAPTFTVDNLSDGGSNAIITTTQETNFEAAYSHVSNDGTDHGYIDQDLQTSASPAFANASLGTGELTAGSINRASGSLTLEIGGVASQTITTTDTTFVGDLIVSDDNWVGNAAGIQILFDHSDGHLQITGGGLVIPNAGYIGSVGNTDAIQIEADGDVVLTQSLYSVDVFLSDGGRLYGGTGPYIDLDDTNDIITLGAASVYHFAAAGNVVIFRRDSSNTTPGVANAWPKYSNYDQTDNKKERKQYN